MNEPIGQLARREASAAWEAVISSKSNREWWKEILKAHCDGTCDECKRMKESRAK